MDDKPPAARNFWPRDRVSSGMTPLLLAWTALDLLLLGAGIVAGGVVTVGCAVVFMVWLGGRDGRGR